MERVDKLVNDILKKWNPLEVPSEIAEDEYSLYVTFIMKYSQNINSIYLCLKKIWTDYMDMDISNLEDDAELKQIARSIYEAVLSDDAFYHWFHHWCMGKI